MWITIDENTLLIIMIMMMMMVIVLKMISKNNVNNHSCHLKGQVSLSLQSTVLCKRASVFFKNIYFSTFIPLLTMLNVID